MTPSLDLSQVDLVNFSVEYVSSSCLGREAAKRASAELTR